VVYSCWLLLVAAVWQSIPSLIYEWCMAWAVMMWGVVMCVCVCVDGMGWGVQ
jgi:hypothetical protein